MAARTPWPRGIEAGASANLPTAGFAVSMQNAFEGLGSMERPRAKHFPVDLPLQFLLPSSPLEAPNIYRHPFAKKHSPKSAGTFPSILKKPPSAILSPFLRCAARQRVPTNPTNSAVKLNLPFLSSASLRFSLAPSVPPQPLRRPPTFTQLSSHPRRRTDCQSPAKLLHLRALESRRPQV
jgi:hypothetical protein